MAETAGVELRLEGDEDPYLWPRSGPDATRGDEPALECPEVHAAGRRDRRTGGVDAGPEVRLAVQDTGSGIPADSLEQIFDRFQQVDTDRDRRAPGSGIGLALVRELVELHGGTIEVESQVGEATRFEILLPSTAPEERPGRTGR